MKKLFLRFYLPGFFAVASISLLGWHSSFSSFWMGVLQSALNLFAFFLTILMALALKRKERRRDVFQAQQKVLLDSETRFARHDHLTGVFNRRGFEELFVLERSKTARDGRKTSLLNIDMDDLKDLNDAQGHGAGDKALISLVSIIERSIRDVDSIARTGGDEFIVLLPETGPKSARLCADRILNNMRLNPGMPLSVSIGAVTFGKARESNVEIFMIADATMYKAKNSGGDQVVSRELTPVDLPAAV